jgi:hypothetical protein
MKKEIWTHHDFEQMGFHDNRVYSINFPGEDQLMRMDIDYIFEWIKDDGINGYSFRVAPCTIGFDGVLNLKFDLNFSDAVGLEILSLEQEEVPDSGATRYLYTIETDKGNIAFTALGYTMKLRQQPVHIGSQCLGRKSNW